MVTKVRGGRRPKREEDPVAGCFRVYRRCSDNRIKNPSLLFPWPLLSGVRYVCNVNLIDHVCFDSRQGNVLTAINRYYAQFYMLLHCISPRRLGQGQPWAVMRRHWSKPVSEPWWCHVFAAAWPHFISSSIVEGVLRYKPFNSWGGGQLGCQKSERVFCSQPCCSWVRYLKWGLPKVDGGIGLEEKHWSKLFVPGQDGETTLLSVKISFSG